MNVIIDVGLVLAIVVLAGLVTVMVVHGYFMLRNRVPYVALPKAAMGEVARQLGVGDDDVVYDLGCGDGRVIAALQRVNSNARYTGVENNPLIWMMAAGRTGGRARIVRGEIAAAELDEATRVFVYLGPKLMAELEPRFERELPKGARVVSVQFPLPSRTPDAEMELVGSASYAARLYVYNY